MPQVSSLSFQITKSSMVKIEIKWNWFWAPNTQVCKKSPHNNISTFASKFLQVATMELGRNLQTLSGYIICTLLLEQFLIKFQDFNYHFHNELRIFHWANVFFGYHLCPYMKYFLHRPPNILLNPSMILIWKCLPCCTWSIKNTPCNFAFRRISCCLS